MLIDTVGLAHGLPGSVPFVRLIKRAASPSGGSARLFGAHVSRSQ